MASVTAALAIGSVRVPAHDVWTALIGTGDTSSAAIVFDLRLPRALAAFAVGGLLALAGALLQALLRNPLADPYLLGLSGGAALGAVLVLVTGATAAAPRTSRSPPPT